METLVSSIGDSAGRNHIRTGFDMALKLHDTFHPMANKHILDLCFEYIWAYKRRIKMANEIIRN